MRKGNSSLKLQIKINGNTYDAEVEVLDEGDGQDGNALNGSISAIGQTTPAPGAYTPGPVADVHSADEKHYSSPVNGLVIRVNVEQGQEIQPKDLLMVLEAMKMETSITAHHGGRVKSVNVAPGNSVKLRQVLIELE